MLHCLILYWIGAKLDMPMLYFALCAIYCTIKVVVDYPVGNEFNPELHQAISRGGKTRFEPTHSILSADVARDIESRKIRVIIKQMVPTLHWHHLLYCIYINSHIVVYFEAGR